MSMRKHIENYIICEKQIFLLIKKGRKQPKAKKQNFKGKITNNFAKKLRNEANLKDGSMVEIS